MTDDFDGVDRTLRVRPYALTGGRTRSANDLPIETIVKSTLRGLSVTSQLTLERKRIVTRVPQPCALEWNVGATPSSSHFAHTGS